MQGVGEMGEWENGEMGEWGRTCHGDVKTHDHKGNSV